YGVTGWSLPAVPASVDEHPLGRNGHRPSALSYRPTADGCAAHCPPARCPPAHGPPVHRPTGPPARRPEIVRLRARSAADLAQILTILTAARAGVDGARTDDVRARPGRRGAPRRSARRPRRASPPDAQPSAAARSSRSGCVYTFMRP